jgi:aromatic-L-amino-acid/L-tryptophan decarboxylase
MASLIDDVPELELMTPVELSIVCFRYVPNALRDGEERLDALNKRIKEETRHVVRLL